MPSGLDGSANKDKIIVIRVVNVPKLFNLHICYSSTVCVNICDNYPQCVNRSITQTSTQSSNFKPSITHQNVLKWATPLFL